MSNEINTLNSFSNTGNSRNAPIRANTKNPVHVYNVVIAEYLLLRAGRRLSVIRCSIAAMSISIIGPVGSSSICSSPSAAPVRFTAVRGGYTVRLPFRGLYPRIGLTSFLNSMFGLHNVSMLGPLRLNLYPVFCLTGGHKSSIPSTVFNKNISFFWMLIQTALFITTD